MNPGRNVRLGLMAFFFIFFIVGTGWGLNRVLQEQPNLKWVYIGGALLAFISGFAVIEISLDNLHRDFQIEMDKEQKKAGRLLSEQEMDRVRAIFKAKRERGETNIRFPLQRLIVRLMLLLPAIIAVSFVVAGGMFLAGMLLALFIGEYRKRTMSYL
jgi:hypothetical protein